jgi:diketogulonate reductase-like aldo/keto reductase
MMRGYSTNPVLANPKIVQIAAAHGVAAAQVVLRWALQKGQVVIPRSSNKERMAQNLRLWEFELSPADLGMIDSLSGLIP